LVRAGETAATRADVAVRELTIRIIHYALLPLPSGERAALRAEPPAAGGEARAEMVRGNSSDEEDYASTRTVWARAVISSTLAAGEDA